jgi:hypothetical protein
LSKENEIGLRNEGTVYLWFEERAKMKKEEEFLNYSIRCKPKYHVKGLTPLY